MKALYTVDLHHEVLPYWRAARIAFGRPLTVVSFDHHTDTLRAFGRLPDGERLRTELAGNALRDETVLRRAVKLLRHDEHFDFSLASGIVERIFLFSSTAPPQPPPRGITVFADPSLSCVEHISTAVDWGPACDRALESSYLSFFVQNRWDFPQKDFVLDLDLDYFKTPRSFQPMDRGFFDTLRENALLVTASRENDWRRLLFSGGPCPAPETILHALLHPRGTPPPEESGVSV